MMCVSGARPDCEGSPLPDLTEEGTATGLRHAFPAHEGALRSPGRANAYFAAAIATGWLTAPLQQRFGLGGVAASQLLLFVLLPLLFNRGHAVRDTFRLRPVRAEAVAHSVLAGILAWVIAQALAAVTAVVLHALGARIVNPYAPLLEPGTSAWALVVFMAAVPALAEEFAFRGLVLSAYRPLGPTAAWVAAGLVFGLMHMSLLRLPTLAALGMIFAYAVQRADSLVPGVIMHFTNNVLTLGAYLIVRAKGGAGDTALVSPAAALFWLVLGAAAAPALYACLRALRGVRESPPPAARPRAELQDPATWLPLLLALPLILPAMLAELHRAFAE